MHVLWTDETKSKARSHLQARKLPTPASKLVNYTFGGDEGKENGKLSFF